MPKNKNTLDIQIAGCAHFQSDLLHDRRSFAEGVTILEQLNTGAKIHEVTDSLRWGNN